jgi:hypothetical protein
MGTAALSNAEPAADLMERFRTAPTGRARRRTLREAAAASVDVGGLVQLGLADDDDRVRELAAFYAGDRGVVAALPRLLALAADDEEGLPVRLQAVVALEQFGHADAALLQSVPPRIRREVERLRPGASPPVGGSARWRAESAVRSVAGLVLPALAVAGIARVFGVSSDDSLVPIAGLWLVFIVAAVIYTAASPDD